MRFVNVGKADEDEEEEVEEVREREREIVISSRWRFEVGLRSRSGRRRIKGVSTFGYPGPVYRYGVHDS